ncbi:MAG: phosphate signaling complex protein PhoU [Candidatus Zixiibacteriota bacterium]
MTRHFQREIDRLKRNMLSLSALVEESVHMAVRSILERDEQLANQVVERDSEIDQVEVEVEEDCLKIMALHQPVAIDLRFLIAVLKINNDLERIGDLAVNIAERCISLAKLPMKEIVFDVQAMADIAKSMLRRSLDALVNLDVRLAKDVGADDNKIDAMHRDTYTVIKKAILDDPSQVDQLIHMLAVSRHLERIADHATNIAEDVIYMINGEIVRHRVPEP